MYPAFFIVKLQFRLKLNLILIIPQLNSVDERNVSGSKHQMIATYVNFC